MKLAPDHDLSLSVLLVVLLTALLVGVTVGAGLTFFELLKTREQIDRDAGHLLAMFHAPALQALQQHDQRLATQVVEALLQHEAIRTASIDSVHNGSLAIASREPNDPPRHHLGAPLLGQDKHFTAPLRGATTLQKDSGNLRIALDTAPYGHDFQSRARTALTAGLLFPILLALLLFPFLRWNLTKPLRQLITDLARIDPVHPGANRLPLIRGHEKNELGQWVRAANQLLISIERNTHSPHQADNSSQRIVRCDPLTGLPNRSYLQLLLGHILDEAIRQQGRVTVLCVGLNDFKGINEQFGYQAGDDLLVALAERLGNLSNSLATLARLGSDRFILVQMDIERPHQGEALVQNILDQLKTPFSLDNRDVRLHATIGITRYPEDGHTPEQLLQKAEQTMVLAKREQLCYQFYIASVDSAMRRRRELGNDLYEALQQPELYLHYQPQLSYQDRRVLGAEALLRWEHPEHGMIPPDQFIPLAEQNGSIIVIGEWVLEQACRQLRQWHDEGFRELRMAVNLSAVQLRQADLPGRIRRLLSSYHLPPGSLELEVTETSLVEDLQTAGGHLLSLRRSGALVAIDDFGTGYSSLSYLKALPVDRIKLDKSFVRDLDYLDQEGHATDATIVHSIIQLGKNLNKRIIAEGVETRAQERYLIDQGCHEGQGYLYSEPLTAKDFTELIRCMQHPAGTADKMG